MLCKCNILIQSELHSCQTYPIGVGWRRCNLAMDQKIAFADHFNCRFQVEVDLYLNRRIREKKKIEYSSNCLPASLTRAIVLQ